MSVNSKKLLKIRVKEMIASLDQYYLWIYKNKLKQP